MNFANWPYYIDVLKGKHLSLEHFTQTTGIQVTYTEPINDNLPFYAKIRPSLTGQAVHRLRHHRDDEQQPAARVPDQTSAG